MESNNAIVCLTRGYYNLAQYDSLIERNKAIRLHINKDNQYPLIIFHEGNISEEHQDYITHFAEGQRLIFKDISEVWAGGYEGMCRFQTYDIWNYCKDYDNIMRIDEDCIIQSCGDNPFDMKGNVYLRSIYFAESHSETNATLPLFIHNLTGENITSFYNDKFVYTNVGIGNVQFWLEPKMNLLIKSIAYSDLQLYNRWGDLPVLGSLLNIYAQDKVGHIEGLSYKHLSHDNYITSNGID
jgi:hypothetical protein